MEISLPDEPGREQILRIHTTDMVKGKLLDPGAEHRLPELAARTKNFSGAELSGLVRTATASAMDRWVVCCIALYLHLYCIVLVRTATASAMDRWVGGVLWCIVLYSHILCPKRCLG